MNYYTSSNMGFLTTGHHLVYIPSSPLFSPRSEQRLVARGRSCRSRAQAPLAEGARDLDGNHGDVTRFDHEQRIKLWDSNGM